MAHLGLSTKCTSHYVSEVTGHIQRLTYKQRKDFNRFPTFLTLKNHTLDLSDHTILPHNKEFRATIAVPTVYDPKAACPAIIKFLSEIVKPEDVTLLLEIIGWCLDANSGMQKLVMMLGSGANGKSTFLELLRAFIGPDNCSSVSLHQLTENRFSMAELYNKLVNIFGDLPPKGIKDISNIKMLTGGDAMPAERKFKDPFSFVNKAKLIFSMNELPSLPEDNLAMWRRIMLIDFPNQFTGTNADKNLLAKLTTDEELSGLLNLALQHLKDVQTKGEFSYFRTIDEVRREYLLKTDPALVFVKERCVEVSDSWISKEDMYQAFFVFCQKINRPAPGKNQFGARLKKLDVVSERQDDWYVHGWVGLKLK
jgi:putative DNA primase/helicase